MSNEEIMKELKALKNRITQLEKELAKRDQKIEKIKNETVKREEMSDVIEKMKADFDKKKFRAAYQKILESIEMLNKETNKPVIFAVDEFHFQDKFKIKNLFVDLGKSIMVQKGRFSIRIR